MDTLGPVKYGHLGTSEIWTLGMQPYHNTILLYTAELWLVDNYPASKAPESNN